jgi:hypothetical protein
MQRPVKLFNFYLRMYGEQVKGTWAQRVAGRQQEVAGLDVAVQDASGVAGAEQAQHLPHRHRRMPLAQRAARLHAVYMTTVSDPPQTVRSAGAPMPLWACKQHTMQGNRCKPPAS